MYEPKFWPSYYADVLQFIPTVREIEGLTRLYEEENNKGLRGKADRIASVVTNHCYRLKKPRDVLGEL